MTTPPKPSLPEINNPTQTATYLPWYRSGVVWLGIFITGLVMAGCIHFIVVTRPYIQALEMQAESSKKEITQFKGMPLFAPTAPSQQSTVDSPNDNSDAHE